MNNPPNQQSYQKPWQSCQDQIALLESRGMVIGDSQTAIEFLQHVNYYRFSLFCKAFESSRHLFADGVTFEDVRDACEFDRDMRDLLTEALEAIELDLRAAVAYRFGERYGPFGHTEPDNFFKTFAGKHAKWIAKLRLDARNSKEEFVGHFRVTYSQFPDLPIWVLTETMSLGRLSWMYGGMFRRDQKTIALRYGFQPGYCVAWFHHLTYVRNLCAHHARLWERRWSIKPKLPGAKIWKPPRLPSNDRLFVTLLILNCLMLRCPAIASYGAKWRAKVEALIDRPPAVANASEMMGLTANWKTHPLWK